MYIGAFSLDGLTLATLDWNTIHLWNVNTGGCEQIWTNHRELVNTLIFSPGGELIATLTGKEIFLWSVTTHRLFRKVTGNGSAMAFSPDGTKLAIGAWSGEVRVCDVESGMIIHKFQGPNLLEYDLAFSPKGDEISAGLLVTRSVIYDIRTGQVRPGWYQGVVKSPFPDHGLNAEAMPIGFYEDLETNYSWLTQGGIPVLYVPEDHKPASGDHVRQPLSLKDKIIAMAGAKGGVTIISLDKVPTLN